LSDLAAPLRVVIDTNTLLRGLLTHSSAAARVRRAAESRRIIPLLSKFVIDEYRAVLSDAIIGERFPELRPELIEITVRRLRFVGDYVRIPQSRFVYRRDPRDEKFLELAIALDARPTFTAEMIFADGVSWGIAGMLSFVRREVGN
jgi:putative PIN family toxin of toxin-antitoxin system